MTGKGGEGSETNALYLARQNGREGRRGSGLQKAAPKCKWGSKLVEVATEEGRAMRGGWGYSKRLRLCAGSPMGIDSIQGTIHE